MARLMQCDECLPSFMNGVIEVNSSSLNIEEPEDFGNGAANRRARPVRLREEAVVEPLQPDEAARMVVQPPRPFQERSTRVFAF
jgi:hypothetical protein